MSTRVVAEDRVLESINVTTESDYSIVNIRLNQQLTVVSYAPAESSDVLRLRVRRTGGTLQINEAPTDFETLPWNPTAILPLYNVTVDLQGAILLYFKRTVKYEVLPATNALHILVKVFHPERITSLPIQNQKELAEQGVLPKGLKPGEKISQIEDPELAGYMDEAHKAMLNKEYSRAIQLYTKVNIKSPKSVYGKQALEYSGLARERNKQFAHAKVIYQQYLLLYPDGEDAERVSQRLSGILTAKTEPKEKLKPGKPDEPEEVKLQWDTFGSISQFYNRNESKFNKDRTRLNRSALQNSLDLTSTLQGQDLRGKIRFSGSYNDNLGSSLDDEERINSLYAEFLHKPLDIELRVGRQSQSSGGILGRFDGAVLSAPVSSEVRLNLVAGYSVLSSRDIFINTDHYFYGINADLGTFFDSLNFNVFFMEQYNQKVLDRRAVGGEIRFFQENQSFFTFVDYDIYHQTFNSILFTGQWNFPDRTNINLSYDYRTSPFLTTASALQGQSVRDVEELNELLDFFSEDEIRDLAKDRTAVTQSLAISLSRPLSENYQFNSDFRVTTTSGTKSSGGVAGSASTGLEYAYSVDLTGSNLVKDGDIYVLGVRYNDLERSNRVSANLNVGYPVTPELRINPRVRFDYRDNNDNTESYGYQASVRIVHRLVKGLQLEVEGGGEWTFQGRADEILALASNDDDFDRTKGYFVIVGYRYNF